MERQQSLTLRSFLLIIHECALAKRWWRWCRSYLSWRKWVTAGARDDDLSVKNSFRGQSFSSRTAKELAHCAALSRQISCR